MQLTSIFLFVVTSTVTLAWVPSSSWLSQSISRPSLLPRMMAIDYNDPLVMEEFNKVQPLTFEEAEEELQEKGIRVSQAMNEMDVKLMLVEVRLGSASSEKKKKRPEKFSGKFEEAMWTKPAFAEFYETLKKKDDHNAMNVVAEYVNNPKQATQRYGKDYKGLLRKAQAALTAPPPVKSPTLVFNGFPANMGEAGCKMTLESIGAVSEFECEVDEDNAFVMKGKVTFEDIESAKAAVAQYNGMDMGMGTSLEMVSV